VSDDEKETKDKEIYELKLLRKSFGSYTRPRYIMVQWAMNVSFMFYALGDQSANIYSAASCGICLEWGLP
jgi:hypothetical protein